MTFKIIATEQWLVESCNLREQVGEQFEATYPTTLQRAFSGAAAQNRQRARAAQKTSCSRACWVAESCETCIGRTAQQILDQCGFDNMVDNS